MNTDRIRQIQAELDRLAVLEQALLDELDTLGETTYSVTDVLRARPDRKITIIIRARPEAGGEAE